MAASGVTASAAAIVSLLTLAVGWEELNVESVVIAGVALAMGVALAYVPWQCGTNPQLYGGTKAA
jgi:hypothetical protein